MADKKRDALKIITLGNSLVGKSKLMERYLMDEYKPHQDSTYALTLHEREVEIDGTMVSIDYWDTAGQERFGKMDPSYYHGAHCCILVFDVTNPATYLQLSQWYQELRTYCADIPCLCAANKIDADPKMTKKKYTFPIKHDLPLYFVSASDGTNVVKLFQDAERAANEYKNAVPTDVYRNVLELLKDDDGFDLNDDDDDDDDDDDL